MRLCEVPSSEFRVPRSAARVLLALSLLLALLAPLLAVPQPALAAPVVVEGRGAVSITLGGTALTFSAGDLLCYSSGWIKADADTSPPCVAELILGAGGKTGDVVGAFKWGLLDDSTQSFTPDTKIYLSTTAAGITTTAPTGAAAINQVIGRALTGTTYEVNLQGAQPQRYVHSLHTLPTILPAGTGAADLVTAFTPGFRGRVEAWQYVTTVVGTGSSASRTPQLKIGSTLITGTDQVALALADTAAVGQVKTLGAPTGVQDFTATDTITAQIASGGTAFTAGSGYLILRLRQEVSDS
jgi:hypothetical protein